MLMVITIKTMATIMTSVTNGTTVPLWRDHMLTGKRLTAGEVDAVIDTGITDAKSQKPAAAVFIGTLIYGPPATRRRP
jgi:hypothetical protein